MVLINMHALAWPWPLDDVHACALHGPTKVGLAWRQTASNTPLLGKAAWPKCRVTTVSAPPRHRRLSPTWPSDGACVLIANFPRPGWSWRRLRRCCGGDVPRFHTS